MIVKPSILVLLIISFLSIEASESNEHQQAVSSDFLDFLIDMEDITGEGFEDWLETDIESDQQNSNKDFDTRSMENQ